MLQLNQRIENCFSKMVMPTTLSLLECKSSSGPVSSPIHYTLKVLVIWRISDAHLWLLMKLSRFDIVCVSWTLAHAFYWSVLEIPRWRDLLVKPLLSAFSWLESTIQWWQEAEIERVFVFFLNLSRNTTSSFSNMVLIFFESYVLLNWRHSFRTLFPNNAFIINEHRPFNASSATADHLLNY